MAIMCTCPIQAVLRKLMVKSITIIDNPQLNACTTSSCVRVSVAFANNKRPPSSVMDFFHALKDIAEVSEADAKPPGEVSVSVMYANADKDAIYVESGKSRGTAVQLVKSTAESSQRLVEFPLQSDSVVAKFQLRRAQGDRGGRNVVADIYAISSEPSAVQTTVTNNNTGAMKSVIGDMAADVAKWANEMMDQRIIIVITLVVILIVTCCLLPCISYWLIAKCVRNRWRRHAEKLVQNAAEDIDTADNPDEDSPPMPVLNSCQPAHINESRSSVPLSFGQQISGTEQQKGLRVSDKLQLNSGKSKRLFSKKRLT